MPSVNVIINERDILKDRIISYEEFMQLMNYLKQRSLRLYIVYGLLAITGCRPCELVKLHLERDFKFGDNPMVKITIGKAKKKMEISENGDSTLFVQQKIVWRNIPQWFYNALISYINTRIFNNSLWLFPSARKGDKHMNADCLIARMAKTRQRFYEADVVKHSWAMEVWKEVKGIKNYRFNGCQKYYRLSLYSFRKMHATLYLKMCKDVGMDAIVATSQHMGHSDPKITMKYLKYLNQLETEEKMITEHGFLREPTQTKLINFS